MTGAVPTPYVVTVREEQVTGTDDYGNDTVEWVESPWAVNGIAPGEMDEPYRANRDQSNVSFTVYGPKVGGYPRNAKAEIRLPDHDDIWFPVIGEPDDWTRGPWEHPTAGLVVALEDVQG